MHPQFPILPLNDLTTMAIIKMESKKDNTNADVRLNSPIINNTPNTSSIYGSEYEKRGAYSLGRIL